MNSIFVKIACVVFLFSYGWGADDAEDKKKSEQILFINGVETDKKYIGWAGEFLFLWDEGTNSVEINSKSSIDSIEFNMQIEKPIVKFK